jgi:hypothetical protein
VKAAGAATNLPLGHEESLNWLTVEGHNFDEKVFFQTRSVTPDYFAAMGIRLVEGRLFTGDDAAEHPLVAIVDQTFVNRYFPGQSPLGRHFHFIDGAPQPTWRTIVGVVNHIRNESFEEIPQPQAYMPLWQSNATAASIVLRTNTSPELIAAAARRELSVIDPTLAIADIRTMGQLVSESTAPRRFQTLLLSTFSGIALVLSLVGLYAMLAYSVRQRTAEIGIRMALGARRSSNAIGFKAGRETCCFGNCSGRSERVGSDALDDQFALRGEANRCANLLCSDSSILRGSDGGVLHSGTSRDAFGSHGGLAL